MARGLQYMAPVEDTLKPKHEMWITVFDSGAVQFEILLHSGDGPITYHFADWKHFIGHFDNMLPLTDSYPLRVRVAEE